MRYIQLFVLFFCVSCAELMAQTPVERFFAACPDTLIPVLPAMARQELLRLSHEGAEPIVANLFGMPSRIVRHTDSNLTISLTPASRLELQSLPTDTLPVICMVHTLSSPAAHSRLQFFSADGSEVRGMYETPDLSRFIEAPDSTVYLVRRHWAKILIPLHVEAQWEAEDYVLRLRVDTKGLSHEERQGADKVFKPVRMRWTGNRWEFLDNE